MPSTVKRSISLVPDLDTRLTKEPNASGLIADLLTQHYDNLPPTDVERWAVDNLVVTGNPDDTITQVALMGDFAVWAMNYADAPPLPDYGWSDLHALLLDQGLRFDDSGELMFRGGKLT